MPNMLNVVYSFDRASILSTFGEEKMTLYAITAVRNTERG